MPLHSDVEVPETKHPQIASKSQKKGGWQKRSDQKEKTKNHNTCKPAHAHALNGVFPDATFAATFERVKEQVDKHKCTNKG